MPTNAAMRQNNLVKEDKQKKRLKSLLQKPKKLNIPKHTYLFKQLKLAIQKGILKKGEKFPPEQELVAITTFSLGTIQKAVQSLVDSRLVLRKQRLGTYICDSREEISQPWHFRFLGEDGDKILPVFPKVILRKKISSSGTWARWLPTKVNSWIRVDRLVNVNDEFPAYSRFFVRADQFPFLLDCEIKLLHTINFRLCLEEKSGVRIRKINHQISVQPCDKEIAKHLRLPVKTICTTLQIFTTGDDGKSIYYQELILPPNPRKLVLRSDLD